MDDLDDPDDRTEVYAKLIYNANRRELPDGRPAPIWDNLSAEVRDWVRNQARAIVQYEHDEKVSL